MTCPAITVAGLGGDSGKTLVSLGLAAAWTQAGHRVAPFKKGPDYIDAAWLSLAAGVPCRNLDTFLMEQETILSTWSRAVKAARFALTEGNRGLYDGLNAEGSHSTAELAKLTGSPVLLVVNVTKMTRTTAAIVLGAKLLDPDVDLLGVVLNNVGGKRHQRVATEAVEAATGVPVIGAIPRIRDEETMIPGRHLGLITTDEHPEAQCAIETARSAVEEHLDLPKLEMLMRERTVEVGTSRDETATPTERHAGDSVRIGVIRDAAFPFYYPENLEALEARGAKLVTVSALNDEALPDGLHALYVGGGFPETHAERLAANRTFHASLREAADKGLPIYAECGGLMFLCRSIEWQGRTYDMTGVLPLEIAWTDRPAGHGYTRGMVDAENPFYPVGTELRGHEFHHSRVSEVHGDLREMTTIRLHKGAGVGDHRDGLTRGNVLALYTHIHAAGTPEWADGLIRAAKGFTN
ncbi:cobyrinate a,c-diamide synthase [bacterium]|nr:cobyrinate a,c-diamide synthase [bacterium]